MGYLTLLMMLAWADVDPSQRLESQNDSHLFINDFTARVTLVNREGDNARVFHIIIQRKVDLDAGKATHTMRAFFPESVRGEGVVVKEHTGELPIITFFNSKKDELSPEAHVSPDLKLFGSSFRLRDFLAFKPSYWEKPFSRYRGDEACPGQNKTCSLIDFFELSGKRPIHRYRTWFDMVDGNALFSRYHDPEGKPVLEIERRGFRKLKNKSRYPMWMGAKNLETGQTSILQVNYISFDTGLTPEIFDVNRLAHPPRPPAKQPIWFGWFREK